MKKHTKSFADPVGKGREKENREEGATLLTRKGTGGLLKESWRVLEEIHGSGRRRSFEKGPEVHRGCRWRVLRTQRNRTATRLVR